MYGFRTGFCAISLAAAGVAFSAGFLSSAASDDGTSFGEKPRVATIQKYSAWMSRLPETVPLCQVSLPGTHDSCALYDGLSFGFAKCQAWHLKDQLKAGIRFIDIRCRHVGNRLLIYHGIIDQRMTFAEVHDVCRKFLQNHPSECVVMSIKEESTALNTTRSFLETFSEATKDDGDLWHIDRKFPKLGAVRQRIVLIDRVGTLGGVRWNDLDRQDQYEAPLELKAAAIQSHFEQAAHASEDQWFINFCSGTLPQSLVTPKKYAVRSNKVALDFLKQQPGRKPARLGTVVMDFPGEEIVERIVETNFDSNKVN